MHVQLNTLLSSEGRFCELPMTLHAGSSREAILRGSVFTQGLGPSQVLRGLPNPMAPASSDATPNQSWYSVHHPPCFLLPLTWTAALARSASETLPDTRCPPRFPLPLLENGTNEFWMDRKPAGKRSRWPRHWFPTLITNQPYYLRTSWAPFSYPLYMLPMAFLQPVSLTVIYFYTYMDSPPVSLPLPGYRVTTGPC